MLFIIGAGTGLAGAMIPGPLFIFTVSKSLKGGLSCGIRTAFGHIMIEAVFVVLIIMGLGSFLGSKVFVRSVSAVGGAALVIMGVIIFAASGRMGLNGNSGSEFRYNDVAAGIFFSAVSPGFFIWWATIGASLFLQAWLLGLAGIIALAAGHWGADIAWQSSLAYSVNRGRRHLTDTAYRRLMRFLASALIVMGVYLPYVHFIRQG